MRSGFAASVLTGVVFIALGIALYWRIIDAFFLSDDFVLLHSVMSTGPFGAWSGQKHTANFFRPIIALSFYLDYRLWHLSPAGYHLTNVLVHGINSFLVARVSLAIFREMRPHAVMSPQWAAFAAGLYFLLLPYHAEAVSWISGRTDVIATFFLLASFSWYVKYRDSDRIINAALSLGLFFLGLLSKESVITYPGLLVLYELAVAKFRIKNVGRRWILPALFLMALVPYVLLRRAVIGEFVGGYGVSAHFELQNILWALGTQVARLFLPEILTQSGLWNLRVLMGLLLIAFVILVIFWRKARGMLLLEAAALLILLIPIASLDLSLDDSERERLIYLPSVIASIVFATLVGAIPTTMLRIASIAGLAGLFAALLIHANENWRSAGRLAETITNDMGRFLPAKTIFVVNLPDKMNGAYVLRNGFHEAMQIFYPGGSLASVKIVSQTVLTSALHRFDVRNEAPNSFEVIPTAASALSYVSRPEDYMDIERRGASGLWVRFRTLRQAGIKAFHYSAGRLWPLGARDREGERTPEILVYRNGEWQFYDFATGLESGGVWTGQSTGCIPLRKDYDGDGKADFSDFCNGTWNFYDNNGGFKKKIWTGGVPGDLPVPADFDGDGKDDVVVYRGGAWLFFDLATGAFNAARSTWTGGGTGCNPAPMDYDGDGTADFTHLCRGAWHFYNADGSYYKGIWTGGIAGDLPVPADYDGDGAEEVVIFRRGAWLFYDFATGLFKAAKTVQTVATAHKIGEVMLPAPLDYNGDGKADFTLYSGGPWHFYNADGSYNKGIWTGGVEGDQPLSRRLLP